MKSFLEIDDTQLAESIRLFEDVYHSRPILDNAGGMGFDHSWATWHILKMLQPTLIIESGVWKGHSTWLIEKACPEATIVCFEPNQGRIQFKSRNAEYHSHDFNEHDWEKFDTNEGLCFFDDHQNSYTRLMQMKWFGFSRAIFEDNPEPGDGDFYSINHVLAGTGAPSLQMNPAYRGGLIRQTRRWAKEAALKRIRHNQNLLVLPNKSDKSNLMRNVAKIVHMPSVKSAQDQRNDDKPRRSNHLVYIEMTPK